MEYNFIFGHTYKLNLIDINLTDTLIKDISYTDFCSNIKNMKLFFYVNRNSKDEPKIYLFCNGNVFLVAIKDRNGKITNSFTIIGKEKRDLDVQNSILYSSIIVISNKICVNYQKNSETLNCPIYEKYHGNVIANNDFFANMLSFFKKEVESWNNSDDVEEINQDFSETLDIIENALDANAEAENGKISEWNIDPDYKLTYSRIETTESNMFQKVVKYRFICNIINKIDILTQIRCLKIRISDNESIDGRIEDVEINNDSIVITLSFEELNVSIIPKIGELEYVSSDFQNEIRRQAINQLRKKTSNPLNKLYTYPYEQIDFNDFSSGLELSTDKIIEEHEHKPNDMQISAIKKGSNLNNSGLLVLGPPGTGKTTVIVDWILYYVSRGKKVLITSMSNMAVDNALKGCLKDHIKEKLGRKISCIRLGSESKIKEENVKNYTLDKQRISFQNEIISNSKNNVNEISNLYLYTEKLNSNLNYCLKNIHDLLDKIKKTTDSQGYIDTIDSLNKENEQMSKLSNDIVALQNKILRRNFLFKLLMIFKYKKEKKELEKLYEKYYHHEKSFDNNMNQYKKYCNTIVEIVKNNINRIDFNECFDNLPKSFDAIKSSVLEIPNDINKLLEELTLKNNVAVKRLLSVISNLCEKCKNNQNNISNHLNEYKKLKKELESYQKHLEKNIEDYNKELIESVDVVGATCIGVQSNKAFKNVEFDVVIIDEAGQILPYDVIVPLSKAKENFIMVGDHLQIPPVASPALELNLNYGNCSEYLKTSYFELLYKKLQNKYLKSKEQEKHIVDLNIQYRMPSSISDLLSKHFYNNNYFAFDKKKCQKPLYDFPSNFILCDIGRKFEEKIEGKGYVNRNEIEIIHKIVEHIILKDRHFFDGSDNVGIIAPYKSQVSALIEDLNPILNNKANLFVNTLDSFQGQERELIIFSFVRSNKSSEQDKDNMIGFLKEARRINVALSRCKSQLICVGNFQFLSTIKEYSDSQIKGFNEFLSLVVKAAESNTKKENGQILVKDKYKPMIMEGFNI